MPQAIGLFAGTNVDDIVVLALLFGQARGRDGVRRVVIGQYLGFAAILVVCVLGALGANLLPPRVLPWLGLIPLGLGLYGGWQAWRDNRSLRDQNPAAPGPGVGVVPLASASEAVESVEAAASPAHGPSVTAVAGIMLANGGDNVGVYIPAFAASGPWALAV